MDIDIVIDEGMDTPTVASEQFDTLSKMMPAMTQLPPDALELLVTASSLRDKDKLLAIVEKMKMGAQNQQGQQESQIRKEMELRTAVADVEETQSKTAKNYADAEAKKAGMGGDLMAALPAALQQARAMGAQIPAYEG
jgi:hypothetical protein